MAPLLGELVALRPTEGSPVDGECQCGKEKAMHRNAHSWLPCVKGAVAERLRDCLRRCWLRFYSKSALVSVPAEQSLWFGSRRTTSLYTREAFSLYSALSFATCSARYSGAPFPQCAHWGLSRCGSDMPPACHSLPRRRFATLEGAALRGKGFVSAQRQCAAPSWRPS